MFGKVLLLALVCVAANSQVLGSDLQCDIEEALRQARLILVKIGNSIRHTIDLYLNGYWIFDYTAQNYWGIVWDYAYGEMEVVEKASLELTEMAKEQNSPKEVFTCISDRTEKANEMLKVIPWTFDERIQREVKRYQDDHYKIAEIAYQYLDTYQGDYNEVVQSLKECDNNENLLEVLKKYEDEGDQRIEELGVIMKNLYAHGEEFKQRAETMLSAVRGTFTFARIAAVDDIKKCMTMSL